MWYVNNPPWTRLTPSHANFASRYFRCVWRSSPRVPQISKQHVKAILETLVAFNQSCSRIFASAWWYCTLLSGQNHDNFSSSHPPPSLHNILDSIAYPSITPYQITYTTTICRLVSLPLWNVARLWSWHLDSTTSYSSLWPPQWLECCTIWPCEASAEEPRWCPSYPSFPHRHTQPANSTPRSL